MREVAHTTCGSAIEISTLSKGRQPIQFGVSTVSLQESHYAVAVVPLPAPPACTLGPLAPAEVGTPTTLSALAVTGDEPRSYSWNPGDGSGASLLHETLSEHCHRAW